MHAGHFHHQRTLPRVHRDWGLQCDQLYGLHPDDGQCAMHDDPEIAQGRGVRQHKQLPLLAVLHHSWPTIWNHFVLLSDE